MKVFKVVWCYDTSSKGTNLNEVISAGVDELGSNAEVIEVDLGARAAGASAAHLPKVVLARKLRTFIRGQNSGNGSHYYAPRLCWETRRRPKSDQKGVAAMKIGQKVVGSNPAAGEVFSIMVSKILPLFLHCMHIVCMCHYFFLNPFLESHF